MLIGNKYKLESDALNVTLYQKNTSKNTNGVYWRPIAYFSGLIAALEFLIKFEVMETGLKDLKTVVAKQKELLALINDLKQG